MQYKIVLIGKDKQSMSKRWMSYSINNQHLDNLDHQVYMLELAVVRTKTLNIYCSHINMVLSWDSLPHNTMKYTVAWKENTLQIFKNIPKSTTFQLFLLYLGCKTDQQYDTYSVLTTKLT